MNNSVSSFGNGSLHEVVAELQIHLGAGPSYTSPDARRDAERQPRLRRGHTPFLRALALVGEIEAT